MKKIILSIAIAIVCTMSSNAFTPAKGQNEDNKKVNESDSIARLQRIEEIKDSLNAIMELAKGGDASAMNEVGTWYYTGKHVKQDYEQAYSWWKKSALKKNIRGIANLGLCYQLGHGVEKDSVNAVRLYVKSISEGNAALLNQRKENAEKSAFDAMLTGTCYETGTSVKKDYAQAAEYYALAAKKGSVDGMRQAGLCLSNAKDYAKALTFFEKGADYGEPVCEYYAGKFLLEGKNVPENKSQAVIYLLKSAESGYAAAQNEIGTAYAEGNGVAKNQSQAAEWYKKSAHQGNVKGMWNYGLTLRYGAGVDKDYDQALFWLSEASSQGYMRAFKRLATQLDSIGTDPFLYYLRGMKLYTVNGKLKEANAEFKKLEKSKIAEGKIMQMVILASPRYDKQNIEKAVKELEKLAVKDAQAAFILAQIYEKGDGGIEQDMTKSVELFRRASDMGFGKAQSFLGDMYYEGRGVEKDLIMAVSLYQKAHEKRQLSQTGATRLAECYENGLAGLEQDKKKAEQLRKEKHNDNILAALKELNI